MLNESNYQKTLRSFYKQYKRDLPWRTPTLKLQNDQLDPYLILVSEMMLQQTQAGRVIEKYQRFTQELPSFAALSEAPFPLVLELWSGLGYNRRARYLQEAAKVIMYQNNGNFPQTAEELSKLKGIGTNTAAAILVYSFNQPHLFVETNIRSVYIHHFFQNEELVDDDQIMDKLEATLDKENPRDYYWALMDYGAHLKKSSKSINKKSSSYVKQTKFEGSRRQVRGAILRELLAAPKLFDDLAVKTNHDLQSIVDELLKEELIEYEGELLRIRS